MSGRAEELIRSLKPPPSDAAPRETFKWIRRWEIVGGVYAVVIGLALWNAGWWHWIPIGVGLWGIAPWGGVATLLRKAEHDPGVFVADPERRRRRGKRFLEFLVPFYVVVGGVAGFVIAGVGGALVGMIVMSVIGGLGVALFMRWMRPR